MKIETRLLTKGVLFLSLIALIVAALQTTTRIGPAWVTWLAGLVIIVAFGTLFVRAIIDNRNLVWTQELRDEQGRRATRVLSGAIWSLIPSVGLLILIYLVNTGLLPGWVGAALFILLLAAPFRLWNILSKRG